MSDAMSLEIKGLQETQKRMEQVVKDLQGQAFLAGMRKATLIVQRDAKIKAPVDTGRLRASITPEVRRVGNVTQGVVGSVVKYAGYVELGTRAHFVSAAHIGRWAELHGFGNTGLRVSGKAQPYLQPALTENAARIVQILGETVAQIVDRSNG